MARKFGGFWVAMGSIVGQTRSGWYVVHFWDAIAGPFADYDDAVLETMTRQNAAS